MITHKRDYLEYNATYIAGKFFVNNYDMEICAMDNLLGKGISGIYYFSFNLGYYYSAGYFTCKKKYILFQD
jgi:hypothetical protein